MIFFLYCYVRLTRILSVAHKTNVPGFTMHTCMVSHLMVERILKAGTFVCLSWG